MKKVALVGLTAVFVASSANAGLLESLGLAKKAEPTTLQEACDMAEIKKVCPEVVLGTETITECLAENVKSLSTKCATFVKKSIAEKKDAAVAQIKSVKDGVAETAAESKAQSAEKGAMAKAAAEQKVQAVKRDIAEKKEAADKKRAADKAAADEKKAAAKAAGDEIVEAVRETGAAAKETGRSLKDLF